MPKQLFQKGVSGNPNGRPKLPVELTAKAKAASIDMLEVLITIAKSEKVAPAARVSAATSVIDRGYGKPSQPVDATITTKPVSEWTEEELDRQLAIAIAGEEAAARSTALTH